MAAQIPMKITMYGCNCFLLVVVSHYHHLTNIEIQTGKPDKKRSLKSKLVEMKGSCLYQVPISQNFVRQKYGELFKNLSAQGIIPLGLLRCPSANVDGTYSSSHTVPFLRFVIIAFALLYRIERIRSRAAKHQAELRLHEPGQGHYIAQGRQGVLSGHQAGPIL